MRLAIAQARQGEQQPGAGEVSAVLVKDGQVLCVAFNEGELQSDPTAHAEIAAIRRACNQLKTTSLRGFTLYCTLQPCVYSRVRVGGNQPNRLRRRPQ
jgi:tRNA(adenine34) deaminase